MGTVERKRISIVTPFYNEEASIQSFEHAITKMADECAQVDFEFVCVDDGSTDNTLGQLVALAKKDTRFVVIELTRNFGKEPALTAGIDVATGDALVPFDADLQDPPELIPVLIKEWSAGAEVVLAQRSRRDSDTGFKRQSAALFYKVHNRLSSVKIPENVGDFRLIDRAVADALKRLPERQRFMKGLFAWVGYEPVIVQYAREPRSAGETKFSKRKLWNFALEGLTSFSTIPLKVWSYIGLGFAILTSTYAFFIVGRTLIFGVDVPGYASILVAVLFMGSLQLISIGVLGEYVGRIYAEAKQRPPYLIRKTHRGADEP